MKPMGMTHASAGPGGGRRLHARRDGNFAALSGYLALPSGATGRAKVLDLSYDGCRIETDVPLAAGQTVKLGVVGREAVHCEVRWFDKGTAGLKFTSAPAEAKQRRLVERTPVAATVTIRRIGSVRYRANLLDLSPDGCKLEFVVRPAINEILAIKFAGIDTVYAHVIWTEDLWAGARFRHPLHPAVFDLLLERFEADRVE